MRWASKAIAQRLTGTRDSRLFSNLSADAKALRTSDECELGSLFVVLFMHCAPDAPDDYRSGALHYLRINRPWGTPPRDYR